MKKFLSLFFIFSFFGGILFAQNDVEFPSLKPIFSFGEKVELLGEDFIIAGLEFSLCPLDSDEGQRIFLEYKNLESVVTSPEFLALGEEERGEKILSLMYEKILKQYSFNQTYIDIMFQKGTYNCVSSSVLYAALAKSAGLTVRGNETTDHAFCTLYLSDGRKIDVETTNPNGFNPGTKKNVSTTANSTKYYTVPKKSYANRKEIGDFRLASLVGKNVTALLDGKKDFTRSVPEAATMLEFLKNASDEEKASGRTSFDIATTNYAVFLDRQKKSDLALDWLDFVESRWGRYETASAQKLYDDIAYNVAVYLPKQGKSERAQQVFDSKKERISDKNRQTVQNTLFYGIVDEATKKMSPEEAISYIQKKKTEEEAADKSLAKQLDSLEEYYWSERLKPLHKQKKYLEAAALLDEGLKSMPNSKNLQTMKNQSLNNYAVDVHNSFVSYYNKKDYENAERVIKEGLEIVPNNANLQRDLTRLENLRGSVD